MKRKDSKPLYKRVWFWILIIFVLGMIGSCDRAMSSNSDNKPRSSKVKKKKIQHKKTTESKQIKSEPKLTKQEEEALKQEKLNDAKLFASFNEQDLYNKGFKHIKKGLTDNPVFVNPFTTNDGVKFKLVRVDYEVPPVFSGWNNPTIAVYSYDNDGKYDLCGDLLYHCDWKEKIEEKKQKEEQQKQKDQQDQNSSQPSSQQQDNKSKVPSEWTAALNSAQSYADNMHMSKIGIYDQLISSAGDKFPAQAAKYAVDHVKADWNKNALKTAKSYRENVNMSNEDIKQQLISEEKFTPQETDYALQHLK